MCRDHGLFFICMNNTGSMRGSNRSNEKGTPQRPLGAHPRRRRSTLISVQEVSPHHYTRPESELRSDMSSVEPEQEQRVNSRVRPLAAHHSRRRFAFMNRLQSSVAPAEPTCTVPNSKVDRDTEKLNQKQGKSQELASGQECEPLPPRRKKMAWTN